MKRKTKPEKIKLTDAQVEQLIQRMDSNDLTSSDKAILSDVLSFNGWLQQQLQNKKITINKLQQLFGFKTEKKTLEKILQDLNQ